MSKKDGVGILCPYCGKKSNGKIIDTRQVVGGRRRRRICESCGERFTTFESCAYRIGRFFNENNKT